MKSTAIAAFFIACLLSGSPVSPQEAPPPETLIDKGACPFECCTYRTWHADSETELLEKPEPGSGIVATVPQGSEVEALTGDVYVTAGIFSVEKAFSRYEPGDSIRVYTYLGEGRFKTWFNGRFYEDDLDSGPFGSSGYTSKLGVFRLKPVSIWWVKIKTRNGIVGWSDRAENFSNKDACS